MSVILFRGDRSAIYLLLPTGVGGVCLLGGSLSRRSLSGVSVQEGGLCPGGVSAQTEGAWMETSPPSPLPQRASATEKHPI